MTPYKRRMMVTVAVVVVLFALSPIAFFSWYLWAAKEVFAGYGAKLLASGVFVAGRTPESIARQELALLPGLKYNVNRQQQTITAWTIPGYRKTAVYREGLGVALAHDGNIETLRQQARPLPENAEALTVDAPVAIWKRSLRETPASRD